VTREKRPHEIVGVRNPKRYPRSKRSYRTRYQADAQPEPEPEPVARAGPPRKVGRRE